MVLWATASTDRCPSKPPPPLARTVYRPGFKSNENLTAGFYYSLTSSITLAAEVGETRSKDYIGQEAKQYGGSFGGIIFF